VTDGSAQWLIDHQGEYLRTVGKTWYCDDDHCNCSEARIVEVYENKVTKHSPSPSVIRVGIWTGPYHVDGEPGAHEDLARKRLDLLANDPELAAKIKWPDGIEEWL
jgi:hypothetical protein